MSGMSILRPWIIVPDTSHWANWIDDAIGSLPDGRLKAQRFQERMLAEGKIMFLSWHHLEELLSVESAINARARMSFLQSLHLIAWMRSIGDQILGSITDILAAEALAYDAGCTTLIQVRDHVREQLLLIGSGPNAIGHEGWVWDVVRPILMQRRPSLGIVAALRDLNAADVRQTIGQLANQRLRPSSDRQKIEAAIRASAVREVALSDPKRSRDEAERMGSDFAGRARALFPRDGQTVRNFIVATYVGQGLDPDEVRDEATIDELNSLATFRSQLRVVAEKTSLPFERLKRVQMEALPSWRIASGLSRFGQRRTRRPGSDVHDQHLAALAAYVDCIYVDKRTHEDLRRVVRKDPELSVLFGSVRKASNYENLLG